MEITYKAQIFFDAIEDDYKEGETDNQGASWTETIRSDTQEELKTKISEATYSTWSDIAETQDDANEYSWASEYWASYLTNEDNDGEAYESEIAEWKKGKLKLWAVRCHILVSEVTESKIIL